MEQHHPGVPAFAELPGHTALFDSSAAARLLGFIPKHTWRTGPSNRPEEHP